MEFDIDRLKILRNAVETYLMLDLNDFYAELFRDNNVVEYEGIKCNVEFALCNRFNAESEIVFKDVNLRDFNFDKVILTLEMLGHNHWVNRTDEEILRDKLLDIDEQFYKYQYKNVQRAKELRIINDDRIESNEKIRTELVSSFISKYLQEFNDDKVSKLIINNNYRSFFDTESIRVFEQRDCNIIDRDVYGYIKFEDYKNALIEGFHVAKDKVQADAKGNFLNKVRKFLLDKNVTKKQTFFNVNDIDIFKADNSLGEFITELIKNRDQTTCLKESSFLINTDTYEQWSRTLSFETDRQTENDNDDSDFDELGDNFYNSNSKYESYGGYNGYDDDTINNAFEGNPENTWNVE